MKNLKVVGTNNRISEVELFTEKDYISHREMFIKDALFNFPHEQLIDFIPTLNIEEMEKIDLLGCELATKIYYELLCAGDQEDSFLIDISFDSISFDFRPIDDLVLFCDDDDLIELLMKDHIYFLKL